MSFASEKLNTMKAAYWKSSGRSIFGFRRHLTIIQRERAKPARAPKDIATIFTTAVVGREDGREDGRDVDAVVEREVGGDADAVVGREVGGDADSEDDDVGG